MKEEISKAVEEILGLTGTEDALSEGIIQGSNKSSVILETPPRQ